MLCVATFAQEQGSRTNPQPTAPDGTKALREEMLTLIAANDRRYGDAITAQKEATNAGFATLREATNAAIAAADRATTKAELSSDRRFESVNEFRKLVDDQQRTFMPRSEAEKELAGLKEDLADLRDVFQKQQARGSGLSEGWGLAVGVVGFIVLVGGVVLAWRNRR